MRDFMTKHKSEIFVGIIVFFLTTLISKIANWIVSATPKIGSSILEGILNLICSLAATQTSTSLILYLFTGILIVPIALFVVAFVIKLIDFKELLRLEHKLKAISNDDSRKLNEYFNLDNDSGASKNEPLSTNEFINKLNRYFSLRTDFQSAGKPVNEIVKTYKHLTLKDGMLLSAFLVIVFSVMLIFPVSASLCVTFERDITIIHPYVEEKDILWLKSDWAQMKSLDDYIMIYEYIDKVKEDYGLSIR